MESIYPPKLKRDITDKLQETKQMTAAERHYYQTRLYQELEEAEYHAVAKNTKKRRYDQAHEVDAKTAEMTAMIKATLSAPHFLKENNRNQKFSFPSKWAKSTISSGQIYDKKQFCGNSVENRKRY